MKKIVINIVFICLAVICFGRKNAVYADTTLSLTTRYLTSEDADYYNSSGSHTSRGNGVNQVDILEGDYLITLHISGNTGFATTGFRIKYNSDLVEPLTYYKNSHEKPVYCKEYVSFYDDVEIETAINRSHYNDDSPYGIIGYGTMCVDGADEDGMIVSFFVRPYSGLNIIQEKNIVVGYEIERWQDVNLNNISDVEVSNIVTIYHHVDNLSNSSFIYGDLDGDGYVTSADAQILALLDSEYGISGNGIIDIHDYSAVYTYGNNDTITGLRLIIVGDVNQDGHIDGTDAQLVLTYYTNYVVNGQPGYTGIIGTYADYYVEYTTLV